ncbi:MAG: SEC-C domain-containing protein [Clostridiales Family XIII bacterium]|jgi:hypothetical protein|nr:SEC-C domain-containing protein [Clostridiales Family XIII bacterium]
MSYYKDWKDLTDKQTDASFPEFWKKYSDAEERIYAAILSSGTYAVRGAYGDLVKQYDVDPVLFMGFLDGVSESAVRSFDEKDLDDFEDSTKIDIEIEPEKLYYNMLVADAKHLSTLPEWDGVIDADRRTQIEKEYKATKTIHKEKLPGRNDPCPCGSGKKYKKCCGVNAQQD